MSTKTDKTVLLELHGIEIRANSIYKITNKPDANAPSGFVQEGTTKLPSKGISNIVPCRYVRPVHGGAGLHDTGFFEGSPCYADKDPKEVKEIVKRLKQHIVVPYEAKYAVGVLDHKNEEFWDSYGVELYEGRIFSTRNVEDLLALYIALLSYELAPKNKLGEYNFKQAQFCIEDIDQIRNIRDERNSAEIDAIFEFTTILKNNRNSLISLMAYVGINLAENVTDDVIKSMFMTWLKEDRDNVVHFQKALEIYNNDKESEVIDVYGVLNKLHKRKKLSRIRGKITYKGIDLGVDLKTASHNLVKDSELQEIKEELFLLS